ncbi:hypothetical protein AMJ82_11930, partial [candidate division TA06 bacterium SM23_40]
MEGFAIDRWGQVCYVLRIEGDAYRTSGPLSEVKMVCSRGIITAAALWLLLVLVPVYAGAEAADPP